MATVKFFKYGEDSLPLRTNPSGQVDVKQLAAALYPKLDPATIRLNGVMEHLDPSGHTTTAVEGGDSSHAPIVVEGRPLVEPSHQASHSNFFEEFEQTFKHFSEEFFRQLRECLTEKERKASEKSIRISDVDSKIWEDFRGSEGIQLRAWPDELVPPKEHSIPAFGWDDRLERTQADRYMVHLKKLEIGRIWMLIDAANNYPDLLRGKLKTFHFRGTTDVAVVDRKASSIPNAGLKLIFELKKSTGINLKSQYQTVTSLVLANIHSSFMRPLAVLTDLVDSWTIYWMDGSTVFFHEFDRRARAVGYLEHILQDEGGVDSAEDIPAVRQSDAHQGSSGERRSLSKRQRFSLPEIEQLNQLVGFIPNDELEQDRMDIVLRHLLQNPAINSMASDAQPSTRTIYL